jgi:Ca2+-binding EF-hand superfamily protein
MMTRAELAFSALDRDKKGYITAKELMKLTKKLSKEELMCLMAKVPVILILKDVGDIRLTLC